MARKPRTPKVAQTSSNKLLDALQFLALVTKPVGAPNETHICLFNQTAIVYNGVLSAGVKIDDALIACPHNTTMIEALSKCGQNISITSLESNRLSIKSDKFKAIVPGLEPGIIELGYPDVPQVEITDALKEAFKIAAALTHENGQLIYHVSFLMNGPSVIATLDGKVIVEFWHGLNLPFNIPVPKAFASVVSKITKPMKSFGMSQSTITIYFNDDSWIKTSLYAEPWPDVAGILEGPSNPYPLPPSFWQGVEAVAPFSEHGLAYFDQNVIRSHASPEQGASFDLEGLPRGPILNIKQLMLMRPYIEVIDWFARTNDGRPCSKFFGKNVRGLIAGRSDGQ